MGKNGSPAQHSARLPRCLTQVKRQQLDCRLDPITNPTTCPTRPPAPTLARGPQLRHFRAMNEFLLIYTSCSAVVLAIWHTDGLLVGRQTTVRQSFRMIV